MKTELVKTKITYDNKDYFVDLPKSILVKNPSELSLCVTFVIL
jgi:hypothetical protein